MSDSPSDVDTKNGAEETYPVQRHAGKVGYGPNYHTGPSLADKVAGYAEELHGKLAHEPQLVKEGHDRATGEAKRRQQLGLDEGSPFAAQEQAQSPKPERPQTGSGSSKSSERESVRSKSTVSSKGEEKSAAKLGDDV